MIGCVSYYITDWLIRATIIFLTWLIGFVTLFRYYLCITGS